MAIALAAAPIGSFINFGLPILRNLASKDLQADVDSISTHLGYMRAYFLDNFGSTVATNNVKDKWLEDMKVLSEQMDDVLDCFMTKSPLVSEGTGFQSPAWRFAMRMVTPRSVQIGKKIRRLKRRSKEAYESFLIFENAVQIASTQDQAVAAPTATTEDQDATHMSLESALLKHLFRTPSESEKKLMVISIVGYSSLGNTLLVDKVYNEVQNRFSRTTRYNAAGKEVGLVIKEILAQKKFNQNVGSAKEVALVIQEVRTPETLDQDAGSVRENGLVIKEIRTQETLDQNAGSTSYMDKVVAGHQEIESAPVKDLKGKAVMENQETESTPIKDLKGKAAVKHHETESSGPSGSSQKDRRYLLVIDNVDMDKLRAIINNFDNEEGGIIIVVTSDCTEAIHCKCAPLDLDRDDQKYMRINDLTNTICKEEGIFKDEIITHKQKLQELIACNYKKNLSSLELQICLVYFCMFPRHYLVRWNHLIRIYEAEGIDIYKIDAKKHNSLYYLKIFIDNHAVHVSENGEVKRCQFPVMMLNHIYDESNSNNFSTSSCCSRDTHTSGLVNPVRRHSLHPISGENKALTLPEASRYRFLRTLAVFHTGTIPNISKLCKYKLLRVLDMKECPLSMTKNDLKKICNLLLLKYLSLGGTVEAIPRDIAKLQWLETLATKKTETVYVPVELMELPRLKHLLGKFQLFERHKQLSKTDSLLQCLSGFVVGEDSQEFGKLMSCMKNLEKVKIWCDTKNWTDHVTAAINTFTREDTSRTRSLSIECDAYPSEIVKCLEHHGTLTTLKLRGDLKTLLGVQVDRPIVQVLQLRKIKVLCLSKTNLSGVEIVSVLKLFLALEYLKLVEDNLGELKIPVDSLYSLSRLRLVAVSNLDRIIISEDSVLCCLVSLHLLVNTKCDLSGIEINKLTKLKEITLYSDVADKTGWQDKASRHQKSPKVLFIQRPNSSDEPSAA